MKNRIQWKFTKTNVLQFLTASSNLIGNCCMRDGSMAIPTRVHVGFLGYRLKFEHLCSALESEVCLANYGVRNLRTSIGEKQKLGYGIIFEDSVSRFFKYHKRILRCMLGASSNPSYWFIFKQLEVWPLWPQQVLSAWCGIAFYPIASIYYVNY